MIILSLSLGPLRSPAADRATGANRLGLWAGLWAGLWVGVSRL